MKIQQVDIKLYHVPLKQPLQDAIHGVQRDFSLIVVSLTTDDGATGMGYTYTVGQTGGSSVAALLEDNLAPLVIGEDPRRTEHLWNKMWWATHYIGRGGIASFAISAIDIALWDLRARLAREPLWRYLGGYDSKAEAYGGGIDFHLSIDELLRQTEGFLDEGLRAVKIKVGRESIAEECQRVAAVRSLIGDDKKLMVDVNMKWSVEQALRASRAFADYNVYWIEEPTTPDDIEGNRRIETEGPTPVASGENLHTIYEFKSLIADGAVSFPDVDISNVGGITAMVKVAHIAEAFNRPVTTHGIQDLHVSCLAAIPNASLLEIHAFRIDDFLVYPLQIVDGYAYASDRIGHGVVIDWEKIESHLVSRRSVSNGIRYEQTPFADSLA
ncbi:mandelate racemase/muconate lactonizing enzyme family protein [Botrimarina hoheduenensis]|uniref:Starvation-sensing protein RspA n=1 Tax=Botrimarina hoheduenensis TaxID=2528000 RepID=A0A5C5VSW5_9BACT|nr:mandelate racemase/muconate lactonizing enzyme family protein [Botrimarina hoheduenensis]TWT40679.1 Starvation-sensing protein RspA [Botrimarina hoheduenensis]